jgi:hypothetical protein
MVISLVVSLSPADAWQLGFSPASENEAEKTQHNEQPDQKDDTYDPTEHLKHLFLLKMRAQGQPYTKLYG